MQATPSLVSKTVFVAVKFMPTFISSFCHRGSIPSSCQRQTTLETSLVFLISTPWFSPPPPSRAPQPPAQAGTPLRGQSEVSFLILKWTIQTPARYTHTRVSSDVDTTTLMDPILAWKRNSHLPEGLSVPPFDIWDWLWWCVCANVVRREWLWWQFAICYNQICRRYPIDYVGQRVYSDAYPDPA